MRYTTVPQHIIIIRPPITSLADNATKAMPHIVELIKTVKPAAAVKDYALYPEDIYTVLKDIDSTNPPIIIFLMHPINWQKETFFNYWDKILKLAQNFAFVAITDPKDSDNTQSEIKYGCGRTRKLYEETPIQVMKIDCTQSSLTPVQLMELTTLCNSHLSKRHLENVGLKSEDTLTVSPCCSIT
jgi:hypothetical protein